jgi:hypothetical protein
LIAPLSFFGANIVAIGSRRTDFLPPHHASTATQLNRHSPIKLVVLRPVVPLTTIMVEFHECEGGRGTSGLGHDLEDWEPEHEHCE